MNEQTQSWDDVKVKGKTVAQRKAATKKKVSKKKVSAKAKSDPVIFTKWEELNTAVLKMDEYECAAALAAELAGPNRRMFKLRLHSRMNKVRAHRERQELLDS